MRVGLPVSLARFHHRLVSFLPSTTLTVTVPTDNSAVSAFGSDIPTHVYILALVAVMICIGLRALKYNLFNWNRHCQVNPFLGIDLEPFSGVDQKAGAK